MTDAAQRSLVELVTREHHVRLNEAVRDGLAAVRIPPELTLSKWADDNFYLSSESSAIEGRWESVPFQRDILDAIGNDDIRMLTWMKSARVGYTKCLLAATAFFVAYRRRSGAVFQPVNDDIKDFEKTEVVPMIRDVEPMRANYRGADPETRASGQTQYLKRFQGAMLYLRGGQSGASYRRLTIDWIFYDEYEGFNRDVNDEGDPRSLGDKRISNSVFPKSVVGSTPRTKHDTIVEKEFEAARHQFYRRWHCPLCGEAQRLRWGQLRYERDAGELVLESVRYQCEHCGDSWRYNQIRDLDEGGVWATDDGYTIDDGALVDPDGMRVNWPRHVAFHISALYSPFMHWSELVEEWIDANQELKAGDDRKLKTFINTRLGETYEHGGEATVPELIYNRRTRYDRPPAAVLLLTIAVDVQDNRLEYEVVGWGEDERSWGISYHVLWGDPTEREVWDELEQGLSQTLTTEDGRTLGIAAVVLDTGYHTDHVYAFWKRTLHSRVYCVKGVGGADKPLVSAPSQRKSGESRAAVPLFLMGADPCKTIVYRRLKLKGDGPGYMHFPDTYDLDYFRMLTAERRVPKVVKGFRVPEWVKIRPRNEALDIRAMSVFAIKVLNPVWSALRPDAADTPAAPVEEPAPAGDNPHAKPRRRRLQ